MDGEANLTSEDDTSRHPMDGREPTRNRTVEGSTSSAEYIFSAQGLLTAVEDACGRSHNDAWFGCIVSSTTASSSTERVSRST
jgi:hypothetical protein